MLARHAEMLFWCGRYLERAEDAARSLDVTYHGLLESPPAEARRSWMDLLAVLGMADDFMERHTHVNAATVSEFLVLDAANPGSIVSTVGKARENARGVRELISSEFWEAINTFYLELQARDLRVDLEQQPYELYGVVKRRIQTVHGAASETMPRDDGWRFLMLGWMLERAEMMCRLLDVRFGELASAAEIASFQILVGVLKSASASEAYRKAFGATMDRAQVIRFLLLSPNFPRGVLYCLRQAEKDLLRVGASEDLSRPARIIGRLRAELEFADVPELLEGGLHDELDRIQAGVRDTSDALGEHYFRNIAVDLHPVAFVPAGEPVRLDIRYRCRFDYEDAVRESQNELRAAPMSDARQQLISHRVVTTPASRVFTFTDYWGTRVDAFGVREPHSSLEVVAEASVETRRTPLLTAAPRLDAVRDPAFHDTHHEYLERTAHTSWGEGVAEEARRQAELTGPDLVGLVLALHRRVGSSLSYVPGSTYVGVPVEDVLHRRQGVCQDFAHLAVAMCRSLGIPARYVSGYLFTSDDATGDDPDAEVVRVQTHAWFEAAVPGVGWVALDPTNASEVGLRHVKIGHGRDYDDVPPLRGAFSGSADCTLDVAVEIRRLGQGVAPTDPAVAAARAHNAAQARLEAARARRAKAVAQAAEAAQHQHQQQQQ